MAYLSQLTMINPADNPGKVLLYDNAGEPISFSNPLPVELNTEGVNNQYPLPTDGDSVYIKDIWVDESTVDDWVDESSTGLDVVLIPFSNLHTIISNSTTNNPKSIVFHMNRSLHLNQVGVGCVSDTDSFSNVKITLLGSGGIERSVLDDSSNDTKYKSNDYKFGPELCNAVKIEFYTEDKISISNITIQKVSKVAARMEALKPDGTVVSIDATSGGNLKVSLEEVESSISTNDNSQIKQNFNWEDGTALYVEKITNGIPNINTDHALIHMGYGFSFATIINTLTGSGTKAYCWTAPSTKYCHLKNVNIQTLGSSIQVDILSGASVTVNTGALIPINNLNDNSTTTAQSTIRESPTYTGGTSIRTLYALADSTNQTVGNANFNANPNEEFVTKNEEEQYIILVTNLTANATIVSIEAFMYEESTGIVSY